jgi:hypothetical protein
MAILLLVPGLWVRVYSLAAVGGSGAANRRRGFGG